MLVACGAAVVLLGGCGEDDQIDAAEAESFIRERSRAPQVIDEVICPDGVEAAEGRTFDCRIMVEDGSEEEITLRQTDEEGHVEVIGNRQVKAPTDKKAFRILPENVESLIRSSPTDEGDLVSIDCPDGVKVRQGNDFECVGRRADGRRVVYSIHQRDDLGNVEIADVRVRR